jgi:hypothetical protein
MKIKNALFVGFLAFQAFAGDEDVAVVVDSALVDSSAPQINVQKDENNGIVQVPTLGISGRTAVGSLSNTQSRWGAMGYYLHPTGPKSHLRIKLGMPLSGSNDTTIKKANSVPDIYTSAEHEWGMKYFGVGCGIALMYMKPFTKNYARGYNDSILLHFNETYAANWVVTLRAGKPNAGFKGRVSWPIPIFNNGRVPENFFLDYSALGVLGNDFIKGGIGIQGMWKSRSSKESVNSFTIAAFGNEDHDIVDDIFVMAPCGKIAVRLAKQSVLCLSTDLGALFLPRPEESGSFGAACVQLDYTFSFKPLHGADVFDGTF